MNVFTWIPHPLHLYHNHFHYQPALPLVFARPHTAACEVSSFLQKVIHSLCWWAVIQLLLSRRCSDDCRTGIWHPTSALSTSQFKKTLSTGILSNFFFSPFLLFVVQKSSVHFILYHRLNGNMEPNDKCIFAYCLRVCLFVGLSLHSPTIWK